jgi:regulator of protease activity HflC (stomatin/prohibitin superfamily)
MKSVLSVLFVCVLVLFTGTLTSSFTIIKPGEIGIKIHLGVVEQNVLGPGLHLMVPVVEYIKIIPTQALH